MLFDLCRSARSIALTIYFARMFREVLWESDRVLMGRGRDSGLEGVANWGSEASGAGGKFWFRALLLICDD